MKKILLIAGLAILVLLQAVVAWNARLYWRAKDAGAGAETRARLLARAERVYPWNAAVPFELGQLDFERAAESLGNPAERDALFRRSVGSYLRSLRLDPASPAAHFELAQALLYMSYLGLPGPVGHFEEYRRAAELTGHNSQIHYDVGKVLLSRWETLAPGEKDFALGILKSSLAGKNDDRLPDLLETWSLSSRDFSVIDAVLPDDPVSLRTYARFLGERGLSLEARRSALARAEALEVARAKSELDRGRREAEFFRTAVSTEHGVAALNALRSVKFYQNLTGAELFDPQDYADTLRAVRRLLAMNRIDETRSLSDPDGTIAAYLALEDDFTALGEFETFIKERGLLAGDEPGSPFRDLETLAFKTELDFGLNRYRDIARLGALLTASSLVIAPSGRPGYVLILRLIGESNLKLDNVYEAERYYRMALEAAPDDLDVLLGLERCYSRLNAEADAALVRRAIGRLTSPAEIDLGGRLVRKGETFAVELVTAGGPRTFRLEFAPAPPGGRPLVGIYLDGRIVWEENGDTGSASFPASLQPGRSTLEIAAVDRDINLVRLRLEIRAAAGPR